MIGNVTTIVDTDAPSTESWSIVVALYMEFLNAHFCFSMTLQLAELTIVMACRLKSRSSVSSTAMTNRRDDCRAVVLHALAAGNVVILFINITYSTGRSASNEKPEIGECTQILRPRIFEQRYQRNKLGMCFLSAR